MSRVEESGSVMAGIDADGLDATSTASVVTRVDGGKRARGTADLLARESWLAENRASLIPYLLIALVLARL